MNDQTFKCSCEHCHGHLLVELKDAGLSVPCPHCAKTITLTPPLTIGGLNREQSGSPPPPSNIPSRSFKPEVPGRSGGKDWLTTFLFAWFLGGLGVDRFYTGRIGIGVFKLLTFGFGGLWTFIDVVLLLVKRYRDADGNYLRPAKPAHAVIGWSMMAIGLLVSCVLTISIIRTVKSGLAELASDFNTRMEQGVSSPGFASPEQVFEHMKTVDNISHISVIAPGERASLAYMQVAMARMMVGMAQDEQQKAASEKAFTQLIEKYKLGDKLEFTDNVAKMEEAAARAFAGVDMPAFMDDLEKFMKLPHSKFINVQENAHVVSMTGLKVDGDKARATIHLSDQTENPVSFVQTNGSWFVSLNLLSESSDLNKTTMGQTMIVTFATEADLVNASAKTLLAGVNYDRSHPATLTRKGQTLQSTLEFMVPVDAYDPETSIKAIQQIRGIKSVAISFGDMVEMDDNVRLRITFASKAALAGANKDSLLAGIDYKKDQETLLVKNDAAVQASLAFSIPHTNVDISSRGWMTNTSEAKIIARIKQHPGVKNVENEDIVELNDAVARAINLEISITFGSGADQEKFDRNLGKLLENIPHVSSTSMDLSETTRIMYLAAPQGSDVDVIPTAIKKAPGVTDATMKVLPKKTNTSAPIKLPATPASSSATTSKQDHSQMQKLTLKEWEALKGTLVQVSSKGGKDLQTGIVLSPSDQYQLYPCPTDMWNTAPERWPDTDYRGHTTKKEFTKSGKPYMQLCYRIGTSEMTPVGMGELVTGTGSLQLMPSDVEGNGKLSNNKGQVRVKVVKVQ